MAPDSSPKAFLQSIPTCPPIGNNHRRCNVGGIYLKLACAKDKIFMFISRKIVVLNKKLFTNNTFLKKRLTALPANKLTSLYYLNRKLLNLCYKQFT